VGHAFIQRQTLSAPAASNPLANVFADPTIHKTAYSKAGMQSALYQTTQFQPDAADQDSAAWLGSTYSRPDGATQMLTDALSTLRGRGFVDQPCYLNGEPNCHLFAFPEFQPGPRVIDMLYATWARGNVLAEVLISGGSWTMVRAPDAIGQSFGTLLAGAGQVVAAATPGAVSAGTAPESRALSVTIDTPSVMHDVRGVWRKTSSLRLNEIGFFRATIHPSGIGVYHADGALDMYTPEARVSISKGGTSLFDGPAEFDVTSKGVPYVDSIGRFFDKAALGSVQVQLTASLAGATDARAVTVSVTAARKKLKKHQPSNSRSRVAAR
jgi:hypothetical protein